MSKRKKYLSWDTNQRYDYASNLEVFRIQGPKWVRVAQELLNIISMKKAIEEREEECKNRLIEMSGKVESRSGNFRFIPTWRRGNLKFEKMPDDLKHTLERYRGDNIEDWTLIYEVQGIKEEE